MHKIDTPDATRDGRFTEGDPTVPVPATTVSADWLNAVQDEVLAVLSVSDKTAFFLLGELVEFDDTERLFSMPSDKRTEDYITGRFG